MTPGLFVFALHVVVAFAAVGFLVVPGAILERVAHTRDVALIRKCYPLASFHGKIGGILSLLVWPLGFAAAMTNGIPLNALWLILAYVAFAIATVVGFGYHARREIAIGKLAALCTGDIPSPELEKAIADPLAGPMMAVSSLLWLFIIWIMVTKPL